MLISREERQLLGKVRVRRAAAGQQSKARAKPLEKPLANGVRPGSQLFKQPGWPSGKKNESAGWWGAKAAWRGLTPNATQTELVTCWDAPDERGRR